MNLIERLICIKSATTIEPLLIGYAIGRHIYEPAINQLELEVACRMDAHYNDTICEGILRSDDAYNAENYIVQTYVLQMQAWTQSLRSLIPILYLLVFIGAFSDKYGIRKPFLLLPVFGELMGILGSSLNVYFMRKWSIHLLGFMQAVVPSLFGGLNVIVMAQFTYLADITTLETRTFRIALIQVIQTICNPFVKTLSAILFKHYQYSGNLSIAFLILLIAFLYGYLYIQDAHNTKKNARDKLFGDIFTTKNVLETCTLLTKQSIHKKSLFLVMVVMFMFFGVEAGEYSVTFLYTQLILHWTAVDFAYYESFLSLMDIVCALFTILLVRFIKLSDYVIIMIGLADKVLANVLFTFAKRSILMYLGGFCGFLLPIVPMALNSLATKVVPHQDVGKAQSIFAACEAFGTATAFPFYNTLIYKNTVHIFPGAFYAIGALFLCTSIILIYDLYKTKIRADKVGPEELELNAISQSERSITTRHFP